MNPARGGDQVVAADGFAPESLLDKFGRRFVASKHHARMQLVGIKQKFVGAERGDPLQVS